MVEAAGQVAQSFRTGLDYAFIPFPGMRGVLAPPFGSAPSAHSPVFGISEPMSLYRASLELASF